MHFSGFFSSFLILLPSCFFMIFMIFFVFFGKPKVRVPRALWVLCWTMAACIGLAMWYERFQWLQMVDHFGPLPSYEQVGQDRFQAQQYQSMMQMAMYASLLLFLPIAWWWGDRRRERRLGSTTSSA